MRILLVEDDRKVAGFIKKGLAEEGYAVDTAADGETGLAMGLDRLHDLIVLDVMLPAKPGFQVVRELRQAKVSCRWEKVTARQALAALLDNYDLILIEPPGTSVARIAFKAGEESDIRRTNSSEPRQP